MSVLRLDSPCAPSALKTHSSLKVLTGWVVACTSYVTLNYNKPNRVFAGWSPENCLRSAKIPAAKWASACSRNLPGITFLYATTPQFGPGIKVYPIGLCVWLTA